MAKVKIETHGCKLNMADSQSLAKKLVAGGHEMVDNVADAELFVLNSCTVTHVADRKARKALSYAKRRNKKIFSVLTGCYAQREQEKLKELSYIDEVVPNVAKDKLSEKLNQLFIGRITQKKESLPTFDYMLGRTRAMVKIQEGCDQVCAYCIVPKVRGRERSVLPEVIVEQIKSRVTDGCKEVVLTGTQLGSYGFEIEGMTLTKLITKILDTTNLERLRVSSVQPQEFTEGFLELWLNDKEKRLCPHFHIPLQSGADKILKMMRRRYTRDQFIETVDKVKRALPEASITTDVIAGFPSETKEDHIDTLEVLKSCQFASCHIFPYSKRPGTTAHHLKDQIDPKVKAQRAKELRELAQSMSKSYLDGMFGTTHLVLWEDQFGKKGLTENYLSVALKNEPNSNLLNQTTQVKLGTHRQNVLEATLI